MRRLVFAVSLTLGACSDNTPGCPDGSTCSDAAPDVVVPFANFLVSVPSVVLDPGDVHPVVVTLDHNGSGPIDITVEGLPSGVTASPLTILVGSPGGKVQLTADANVAVPQDVDVTLRATAAGAPSLTAPLHVRVGSAFHVATTSESFQVPSNLSTIELRVWGAGGGAGGGMGGLGGGGGFATTQIPVTGGETLDIVVGGGGPAGSLLPPWTGGVGGGYSAVIRGTTVLLIAGGGGGGGGTGFDAVLDAGGAAGLAGGGGGGNQGENGGGACGGGGGTDAGGGTAGPNAEAGASLFGGGGASPNGGGGGFGFFGGGGGGVQDASAGFGCGGGGGSAFATALGSSSKLLAAAGQIPAGITVVGYGDSGVAMGGGVGDAGQPFSGAAGLVVVAYPK